MADVLALFAVAVITVIGGLAVLALTRAGRRKALEHRRDAPRRLRAGLAATDDYIRQVDQALTDDELDRLEEKKGK